MTNRSTTEPTPDGQTVPIRAPGPRQAAPPSAAPRLVPVKLTHVGRARPHNEDYVDLFVPDDPQLLAAKGSLFLVADGMGGHQAGEVASQRAVEMVSAEYYRDTAHDVPTSLVRAFLQANEALHAQAQVDASKGGMGTTMVAAAILGARVYVANVGDSRAYLIDAQSIRQITQDHSWVEEQVRAGLLTAEQARRHPQRNLVTRALGSKPAVEVDLFEGEVAIGQTLLLCSDGLTGRVSDAEIADLVRRYPPAEAAKRLIDAANERGGNDNITVLLIHATDQAGAAAMAGPAAGAAAMAAPVRAAAGRRGRPWVLAAVAALVLAGVLAAVALMTGLIPLPGSETHTPPATATVKAVSTGPNVTPLPPTFTPAAANTATLVPTSTETITGTATSSVVATGTATRTGTPTPTSTPAVTPSPTSTPWPYQPVTLMEPLPQQGIQGSFTFKWDLGRQQLRPGHVYRLRIWDADGLDVEQRQKEPFLSTIPEITVNLDDLTLLTETEYSWSIEIVEQTSLDPLSPRAPTRTFIYLGPVDGLAPTAQSTP